MPEKQLYRLVNNGQIAPEDFLMAQIFYIEGEGATERPQVTDENQLEARRQAVSEVLAKFPGSTPEKVRMMSLRFGLEDRTARSRDEVATIVGLSAGRVRIIEKEIVRRLRHPSITKNLKKFLPKQQT